MGGLASICPVCGRAITPDVRASFCPLCGKKVCDKHIFGLGSEDGKSPVLWVCEKCLEEEKDA